MSLRKKKQKEKAKSHFLPEQLITYIHVYEKGSYQRLGRHVSSSASAMAASGVAASASRQNQRCTGCSMLMVMVVHLILEAF